MALNAAKYASKIYFFWFLNKQFLKNFAIPYVLVMLKEEEMLFILLNNI